MNSMTLPEIGLFFVVSAAGGAMNSVAGGGTFIVFPMLIMNGLGAVQANIMSTIALWPGSVSSAYAYRRELIVDRKHLGAFMAVSVAGSAIGTAILLLTPERTFEHLVPWLLLAATLLFTFGRYSLSLWERVRVRAFQHAPPSPGATRHPLPEGEGKGLFLQFLIAIYGGYFGAGIGILMLAMLQMLGLASIHRMNALKSFLGSTINAVAVAIFILSGRVLWHLALVMIVGAMAGGYFGARLALKVPPEKVRLLVSAIGFSMTAYFFLR